MRMNDVELHAELTWPAYERAKIAEQEARGAPAVAHQEGMVEGHKSGLTEGHKSVLAEGKAGAILAVLATHGLALDEATRARSLQCSDTATLERWLIRAVTARSAEDGVDAS
jgi:hypothetical protein